MLLLQRSFCCNCTPLLTVFFSLLLYFWLSVLSREMADQMFSSGRKVQWIVKVLATWASPLGDLSRGRKGQLEQPRTDLHWELLPLPYWEFIFRKLWDSDGDTCGMKIRQCFHSVWIHVPTVFTFFATSTHETFIRCMFSISSALVETSVEYRADSWAWAVQTFITCRGAIYQLMCVPDIQLMSALAPPFVTNIIFSACYYIFLGYFKSNSGPNIKEIPLISTVSLQNVCTFKEHCMETGRPWTVCEPKFPLGLWRNALALYVPWLLIRCCAEL